MRLRNSSVALVLTTFCVTGLLSSQTWHAPTSANVPDGRVLHAMAYDLAAGRSVMFGGMHLGLVPDGETWTWDGSQWSLLTSSLTSPSPRFGHALAYDSARAQTVLFGGTPSWGNGLGDTWTLQGGQWLQHTTAIAPSARSGHAMAFDGDRAKLVLFGGGGPGGTLNDTWWWNGNEWLAIFTAQAPSARWAHAMAFDTVRARVVLFGGLAAPGQRLGDLHEWDGSQWLQVQPPLSPSARSHATLVYDASLRGCVLIGGDDGQTRNDSWLWDGVTWTQLAASGPSARTQSAAAFDLQRRRTVMFGGGDFVTVLSDTWELDSGTPAPSAATTTFGTGCGTPPLTCAPLSGSRPLLGSTQVTQVGNLTTIGCLMTFGTANTHVGQIVLPLTLEFLGMPGCRLYHDFALGFAFCQSTGATTAEHQLPIPLAPSLIGVRLYLQASAASPASNVAGLVTGNAIELILGDI